VAATAERLRAARVAAETTHALTLAGTYAQAYAAAKTATGALDFADLIVRARTLLTEGEGPGAAWVLFKLDGSRRRGPRGRPRAHRLRRRR